MATYDELVADIGRWLIGHDLTSVIPRLIALAEDRHANDLRVRAMTKRSRLFGNGTVYMPLPKDYMDMRVLRFADDRDNLLQQIAPNGFFNPSGINGARVAREFAIHEELEFDQVIATTVELEMIYWSRFPRLTVINQTNWLSDNDYGCYLYATLVESGPYIRDTEQTGVWEAAYQTHVASLQKRDLRSRTGGQPQVRQKYASTP